jgi:hypothetical protein
MRAAGRSSRFDPVVELIVNGQLFTAPIGGTAQDHGLAGLRRARELDVDAVMDGAPTVRASKL